MNININPLLETTLAELAQGQGQTVAQYAEHIVDKHLLGQMKTRTIEKIAGLPIADIKKVADDVKVLADSKILVETPEEAGIITK